LRFFYFNKAAGQHVMLDLILLHLVADYQVDYLVM